MYKLFTDRYEPTGSVIRPPGYDLVRRMYQKEVLKIISYYHSRVYAVKSNHLLCRLINTSTISLDNILDRYTEIAFTRGPFVAKNFLLTTETTPGITHDGVFFGPGSEEIIIYNDDYFNPHEVIKDWRNIRAVEVLGHEISDFSLLLPNGKRNNADKGLCFISLNLPLLMVQYRGFLREQSLNSNTADYGGGLGISHFVNMYVLPNMLYSHIEHCLFNRFCNIFYKAPMGEGLGHYPFPILDYTSRLDSVLKEVIDYLTNKSDSYSDMLANIPAVFKKDMGDVLVMPDLAKTRQIWWALQITRLKAMKLLKDMGNKNGINYNRSLFNRGSIDFERLLKDPTMYKVLYPDTLYEVRETINEFLND